MISRAGSLKNLQDEQVCETQLILLGESPRHLLRMAVDGMKEPGETEAEDSPKEEHPKHHFLL